MLLFNPLGYKNLVSGQAAPIDMVSKEGIVKGKVVDRWRGVCVGAGAMQSIKRWFTKSLGNIDRCSGARNPIPNDPLPFPLPETKS
jgi:hypothetical protein